MATRKLLYVILDGLGDEPHPDLGNRTPLEAARTPNLDALAAGGRTGDVVTVGEGIAPESDIAVFAILGYDPHTQHAGRGPLEALGAGLEMRDGDLAWRANFATVDESGRITDRRAGRDLSTGEAEALAEAVNEKVSLEDATATLLATSEHRGVLHLRAGVPLSAEVSNTDPAYERRGSLGVALETFEPVAKAAEALDSSDGARLAAELTNRWTESAQRALEGHPVNVERDRRGRPPGNLILVRDAGDHIPVVQSLRERFGMSFACFAEMPVEIGIAKVTGMEPILISSPGSDPAGYAQLAERTLEVMGGYDALYVHLKGPDVPAHDGRARDKQEVIEAIDEGYFGALTGELGRNMVLAVTADHSTSCVRKAHTADPVPLLVVGGSVTADGSQAFSEREAASGSLGRLAGTEVLPLLVDLARD